MPSSNKFSKSIIPLLPEEVIYPFHFFLNSNLVGQKSIFSVATSTLTANTGNAKSCNWQDYQFLIMTMGTYANIDSTLVITTEGYFKYTNSGTRPILIWSQNPTKVTCKIYQNWNGSIILNPSSDCVSQNNFFVTIFGLIKN